MPTQKWAYQVGDYGWTDDQTQSTALALAGTGAPWSKQDGPETPVGEPNLILESVVYPGKRLFYDLNNDPVELDALECDVDGNPPHR